MFDDEMKEAAMQNERFVLGESVFKFEEEFAQYCGTKFAVSTSPGAAALTLSLVALGVAGGEVVTTSASFVASANSVIHAGESPRFADITLDGYTIDPLKVGSSLNEQNAQVQAVFTTFACGGFSTDVASFVRARASGNVHPAAKTQVAGG